AQSFLLRHAPPPARRRFGLGLLRRRPRGTFEIRDGKLFARGPAGSLGSARRVLEAFAIAQSEGPELSEELKLDVRESLPALDRAAGAGGDDPSLERFRKVFAEVAHPETVYLGLLLHDIGKGHGGGHVRRGARIAERVCARLGLDPERALDVTFLVEAHLEM